MKTDWNNPEINPYGFVPAPQKHTRRARVSVPVEAKVHASFTSADGNTYVCVYLDETRKRAVYLMTENGFVEVTDEGIRFTIARMTDEILESLRV
ncbi:MAG: hypothetical protein ACLP07_03490 [Terracidiphilus sp.]